MNREKVLKGCSIMAILAMTGFAAPLFASTLEQTPTTMGGSEITASSTKTMDEIHPNLNQKQPTAERFELILDGAGVLDKKTGLIWEQSPAQLNRSWTTAASLCYLKETGGLKGWHLPTIEDLASIVDTSVAGSLKLPKGHPFDTDCKTGGCVKSVYYWSATSGASDATNAWVVNFTDGGKSAVKKNHYGLNEWCVQSDQNYGTR